MGDTLFPTEQGGPGPQGGAAAPRPDQKTASKPAKYSRARHNYGDLVGFYVDTAREQNSGADPPRAHRARMGKEIGQACQEGQHPELIREAIRRIVRSGVSPAGFSDVLWQTQCDLKGATVSEIEILRAFLATIQASHGINWPTGSRWISGPAAGTFVPDPLGCDKPTYPVPWSRPTRKEVIEELVKENRHAKNPNP